MSADLGHEVSTSRKKLTLSSSVAKLGECCVEQPLRISVQADAFPHSLCQPVLLAERLLTNTDVRLLGLPIDLYQHSMTHCMPILRLLETSYRHP